MEGRLNRAGIQLIELFHIIQDAIELVGEEPFFLFGELQARKARHILNLSSLYLRPSSHINTLLRLVSVSYQFPEDCQSLFQLLLERGELLQFITLLLDLVGRCLFEEGVISQFLLGELEVIE